MKIAQKLGLLVGSLLVAVLATILLLSAQISSISGEYDRLLSQQVQQGAQARLMQVEFEKQVQAFKNILLRGSDPAELATYEQQFAVQDVAVKKLNDQLLSSATDRRLRTSLTEFESSHATLDVSYQAARDEFIASGETDAIGASGAVLGQDTFPTDLIDLIVGHTQRSIDESVAAQQSSVDRHLRFIYAAGALLLLLAAVAVTLVVRGIIRPVRALTAAALDAANNQLPAMVARIATLPADAQTPRLPGFTVTSRDELAELASALTTLQDSAVGLALDQRRNEQANSETLVNLGRRNQSLLTRMLSYVTELERDERDPDTLDKLFRLDHLTTRIRRNAESLLVLAGAKQTRTWSQPIAMDDVLRAALSEIEEYTRVTVHQADPARVLGGVAADLTHMLAELLENATRFSPRDRQVLVVGRLTPSGYQFDVIDSGLGMSVEELLEANDRIVQAGQKRPDTKVLGHHVVGRIAARRGMFVRLLPSVQNGITAQVLVPVALLSDAAAPVPPALSSQSGTAGPPQLGDVAAPAGPAPDLAPAPDPEPLPAPEPPPAPAPMPVPMPMPAQAPVPLSSPPPPAPVPASVPAELSTTVATVPHPVPVPAPRPEINTDPAAFANPAGLPGRRVRGAQLEGLGEPEQTGPPPRSDAETVRSQMSSLQTGVAAARNQFNPQPIPYTPDVVPEEAPAVPGRRVRGAQLAELGPDIVAERELPPRDPAAVGRQLSGLQAATARARLETGQAAAGSAPAPGATAANPGNDDTFGSHA